MRKILIVLLVVALLFAGCARKGADNQSGIPSQNQTGTQSNQTGGQDIGNLFHVDTDKPVEGGGYDVPAAGQNSS